jgi:hypothetical protein
VRRKLSPFQKALRDYETEPYQPPTDEPVEIRADEPNLEGMSVDELRAELRSSRQREQEAREIAQAAAQQQASARTDEAGETLTSRLRVLQGNKGKHWS